MTRDYGAPMNRISNWTIATGTLPGRRAVRKVVVVSRYSNERAMASDLGGDCDIVCVESPASAYSQIKRTLPSLVVMYLEMDDLESLHVMSMLRLDPVTADIPVLTYAATGEPTGVKADSAFVTEYTASRLTASPN